MPLFRSKAERKLVERGLDPARLPPGQYLTEKWPVLHSGTVPKTDLSTWDFRVFGEVDEPLALSWEEVKQLPSREVTVDIHCVTRWRRFDASAWLQPGTGEPSEGAALRVLALRSECLASAWHRGTFRRAALRVSARFTRSGDGGRTSVRRWLRRTTSP